MQSLTRDFQKYFSELPSSLPEMKKVSCQIRKAATWKVAVKRLKNFGESLKSNPSSTREQVRIGRQLTKKVKAEEWRLHKAASLLKGKREQELHAGTPPKKRKKDAKFFHRLEWVETKGETQDQWMRQQRCTMEVAPISDAMPSPQLTEARKKAIQLALHHRKIPLECRDFVFPKERNMFHQEQVESYLNALKGSLLKIHHRPGDKQVVDTMMAAQRKFYGSIQHIRYEELQSALSSCVQRLNTLLGGQEYAIGFTFDKSQEWVGGLALPLMDKTPREGFRVYAHGAEVSFQSKLSGDADNFVVCDDASYSGQQMSDLLKKLVEEIVQLQPQRPRKIYFVIPFMSEQAKDTLENTWDEILNTAWVQGQAKTGLKTELCIITSDMKLRSLSGLFPEGSEDWKALFNSSYEGVFGKPMGPHERAEWEVRFAICNSPSHMLTFTDWKTPDTVSVSDKMIREECGNTMYTFLDAEFIPPYKRASRALQ